MPINTYIVTKYLTAGGLKGLKMKYRETGRYLRKSTRASNLPLKICVLEI
jgi:hypothetical protein